jgi:hypothetical protein
LIRRTFVASSPAELAHAWPEGVAITHEERMDVRLPIDIAITEQSDRGAVLAALERAHGRPGHGLAERTDDGVVVSFLTHTVRPPRRASRPGRTGNRDGAWSDLPVQRRTLAGLGALALVVRVVCGGVHGGSRRLGRRHYYEIGRV